MKLLKTLTRQHFMQKYPDSEACYRHLAHLKWYDGFTCRKCGYTKYCKGAKPHSRRCIGCRYDESPTAHTLFHKLKFELHIAFQMLYDISTHKKGASSIALAERYGIQQKSAWLFRQKVQQAMFSSEEHPLTAHVHVDEFEIGTPQEGEQGRSKSEKKTRVVLAMEYRDGKPGRGYAQVIDDFSAYSLIEIFDRHIDNHALIETDGWTGYKAIKNWYPGIQQKLSDKGRNFKMIHLQIRNFKNWLRGTHSYSAAGYLQKYIEEYFYRFNRRTHRGAIVENLLRRIVDCQPITYKMIKAYAT